MVLQKTLNPKLFKDNKLIDEVRTKIFSIVNEFKEFIEIPINILDIRIVGSNASYNYNEYSDLDIHLIVNYMELSNNTELVDILFNTKRKSFNQTYDITIKGIDAEMYVEDVTNNAISNGIYSVSQNCWIKFPKKIDETKVSIPNINDLYNRYKDKCEKVLDDKDTDIQEVTDLINAIYMLRKNGLATNGEYSKGNLTFKALRNDDYISKLIELQDKLKSKELSLEKLLKM